MFTIRQCLRTEKMKKREIAENADVENKKR